MVDSEAGVVLGGGVDRVKLVVAVWGGVDSEAGLLYGGGR